MSIPKIPSHLFKPITGKFLYRVTSGVLEFDLIIPLEPFDSGLGYVNQPEKTAFCIENNAIPVQALDELDGKFYVLNKDPMFNEGSLYIGYAHNPVDLKSISFKRVSIDRFEIAIRVYCDFEYEGVASSETIDVIATVQMIPKGDE